ncbi:MAG: antitoxin [Candidatus Omnitrophica bacterium]|nr:antitoxin [Candidatus Omnitrophota bacterium]
MRKVKLTKEEKAIEDRLEEYTDVSKSEFQEIAQAINARKKDAVLNIRINQNDLKSLKQKASKLGIKYQTFISEVLHRLAQS